MPKHYKLNEDEKEKLGTFIVDTWREDNEDREEWLQGLTKWAKAYQGRPELKSVPWPGASNLRVPVTQAVVDAVHPRIMAALYNPRPIVAFQPQEASDSDLARKEELFLDWAIREDINLFPTLDRGLLAMIVNGMQFFKTTWDIRVRKIRDKHRFDLNFDPMQAIASVLAKEETFAEAINRVTDEKYEAILKGRKVEIDVEQTDREFIVYTEREEVIKDGPSVVSIDPEDVAIPSNAGLDLTNDADHVIHRYWLTMDQIKREVRKGVFHATEDELDSLESTVNRSVEPDDNTYEVKQARDNITGATTTDRQASPDKLEVLDAYILWDVDDDGYEDQIIVTVPYKNPNTILRVNRLEDVYRHGRRPFTFFPYDPVANSVWAIGIPQKVEGLQQEFEVIHNQRVDAGQVNITPWGWYVPTSTLNPDKIPIEPGFMQPVDDINAVRMHQPSNFTGWSFQEEAGLWALLERLTKVSDLTFGRIGDTQGAARTATGVNALSAQQATGFDLTIRRVQESFKMLLQQIRGLYQQYMPPGRKIRILGSSFSDTPVVVSREDITGKMDMIFTGNSLSTDREIERNTATFLAQSAMNPGTLGFLLQLGITTPQGIAEWFSYFLGVFDVPRRDRIITVPVNVGPMKPDEIINRLLNGESLTPKMGEDHRTIIQRIQELLQSRDVLGLSPEVRMLMQQHAQMRTQQMQQEVQIKQQIQQMQMMQQFKPPYVPGVGGAPPQLPQNSGRLAYG